MNDIQNRITSENQRLNTLNRRKEELIYDIPNYLNEQAKKSLMSTILITTIFTTLTTVLGGWILMDYVKLLLPSLLLSGSVSSIISTFNYFSKTASDRRKLKNSDIQKINHYILNCEKNIKYLKQELIRTQSMIINDDLKKKSQPLYSRQKMPQQVQYSYENNYETSRVR